MSIDAYNLDHEAVAAFDRGTATMTLTSIEDCQAVTLTRRGQLLLLNALCMAYGFESPVASIVRMTPVGPAEDQEDVRA